MTRSVASCNSVNNVLHACHPIGYTDLEVAPESSHEPSGVRAEHRLVTVVLLRLAVADLADRDIGEEGIVVEANKVSLVCFRFIGTKLTLFDSSPWCRVLVSARLVESLQEGRRRLFK